MAIIHRRKLLKCAAAALLVAAPAIIIRPAIARLQVNQLYGFGAGGEAASLAFINSASSATDAASYDFGNFTAPTDGLMIAGVVGRANPTVRTLDAVSIGGTNGTIHVGGASGLNHAAVASRLIAAGANNVTVTFSGTMLRAGVFVWLLTNYSSATPFDTDFSTATGTSLTATLDIPATGFAVYAATWNHTTAITWSSATDRAQFATESRMTGADKTAASLLTNHAEVASAASAAAALAGASWV